MDEDIGLFEQSLQHRLVLWLFDVEVDRLLVAVQSGENRAVLLRRRIARMAHQVARCVTLAILYLDDFGAQIGEVHRGKWPKHHRRHVDDLDAFERSGQFAVPLQFRPYRHFPLSFVLAYFTSRFNRAVKRIMEGRR